MATVADLAAGASGAGAILGVVLAGLAIRAYQTTRSSRNLYLAIAFAVSAVQAGLTGYLLQASADLPSPWLAVPIAHAVALLLMYAALLRV
jgi:Mg/Co/Ni transporter MgtE